MSQSSASENLQKNVRKHIFEHIEEHTTAPVLEQITRKFELDRASGIQGAGRSSVGATHRASNVYAENPDGPGTIAPHELGSRPARFPIAHLEPRLSRN